MIRRASERSRRLRAGFTLVETALPVTILTIGMGSAVMTIVRCSDLQEQTRRYTQAHNVCRDVLERLRGADVLTSFQQLTANPTFTQDGMQVTVDFPQQVLIDTLGPNLPNSLLLRDLNGDGAVDVNAAGTDPVALLPVRLQVSWLGGNMTLDSLVIQR